MDIDVKYYCPECDENYTQDDSRLGSELFCPICKSRLESDSLSQRDLSSDTTVSPIKLNDVPPEQKLHEKEETLELNQDKRGFLDWALNGGLFWGKIEGSGFGGNGLAAIGAGGITALKNDAFFLFLFLFIVGIILIVIGYSNYSKSFNKQK